MKKKNLYTKEKRNENRLSLITKKETTTTTKTGYTHTLYGMVVPYKQPSYIEIIMFFF